MALTFNEGAYGQAYQRGLENEAGQDLNQVFGQPIAQGLQYLSQSQQLKAKAEQDKKLYELQLAEAQNKQSLVDEGNMGILEFLSGNKLSSGVAPQSMLDQMETPQGMGEAAMPMGQQPGGSMIDKFRQFQQGKLRAPQMDMSQQQPDLAAFGLPPEAAGMTLGQVKRMGEARKLFAEAGQGDYYTPDQAKGILQGDLSSFGNKVPGKAVQQAASAQRSTDALDFRREQADAKVQATKEKAEAMSRGLTDEADLVINKVDQALSKVGRNTAGIGGSIMGRIPGTEATDLEADIDTIKAVLGFNKLAEMRRNSPTGGALGNVSDRELKLLTAARASLDQKQSPAQLKARLQEIKTHYQNWLNAVNGVNPDEAGGQTGTDPALPIVTDQAAYNSLSAGTQYKDAKGITRRKK